MFHHGKNYLHRYSRRKDIRFDIYISTYSLFDLYNDHAQLRMCRLAFLVKKLVPQCPFLLHLIEANLIVIDLFVSSRTE